MYILFNFDMLLSGLKLLVLVVSFIHMIKVERQMKKLAAIINNCNKPSNK